MFPEYIRNGTSLTYLNGRKSAIFWRNPGKNGIGTNPPEKRSAQAPKIVVIPFSSIVFKTMTLKNVITEAIRNIPTKMDIINNKNAGNELGGNNLYG